MELEIQPEPTAVERAAIEAALARVLTGEEPAPSRWWQSGIRENLEGDEEEPPG